MDLNKCLEYIDQLFDIYCIDFVHSVIEDADFWSDYLTTIQYANKIDCTKANMKTEFRNFYPECNKQWPKYMRGKKSGNMNFWKNILSYYSVSYPNPAHLVKMSFSVSGGTSPLERPYSKLAKLPPLVEMLFIVIF